MENSTHDLDIGSILTYLFTSLFTSQHLNLILICFKCVYERNSVVCVFVLVRISNHPMRSKELPAFHTIVKYFSGVHIVVTICAVKFNKGIRRYVQMY